MKYLYIPIFEFIEHNGKLTKDRELFSSNGSLVGYYVEYDNKTGSYILSNASYKSFPFSESLLYVKVQAIPVYN